MLAQPGQPGLCESQWAVMNHNGKMRTFDSLSEREILSLAVALEEEDERIYGDYADGLREDYPATAEMFEGMREQESGHRRKLI